jgi:hypothetical protein
MPPRVRGATSSILDRVRPTQSGIKRHSLGLGNGVRRARARAVADRLDIFTGDRGEQRRGALMSAMFPPVSRKARGRPSLSTRARILACGPPPERPMAWSSDTLFGCRPTGHRRQQPARQSPSLRLLGLAHGGPPRQRQVPNGWRRGPHRSLGTAERIRAPLR